MTDSGYGDIQQQIMWTRLLAVVEEQARTLMRTAFSTTVREAGDLSAGVFDSQGRMLAQAVTGTPGHVNTMAEGVRHFLAAFPPHTMRPDDHYITNDPWLASGHLHDITVVSPVHRGDRVIALFACCCHQVDIGGLGQGTDGRSIYEEGLQIPMMKLVREGTPNEDLLAIIRANVRTPREVEGDVMSYAIANEASGRRLLAMMDEFAIDDLDALGNTIIERSRAATLAEIARLPRGTWSHAVTTDGHDEPITLRARLTIGDGEISIDYAGSSPASRYGINVVHAYTVAYTVFALKCIVAPEIPNNAGSLAPFAVVAPRHSILNAERPWPVAARHLVGQFLPDLLFGCLNQGIPSRVPAEGASCLWTVQLRGLPQAGEGEQRLEPFDVAFFNSGGTGARPHKDGLSATAFPSGVRAMPVEVTESKAPIVIWRKELRPGSGGVGRFRGGLGQVIEVAARTHRPMHLLALYDRVANPARGREGGAAGAPGRVALASGQTLAAKGLQVVPAGDRLRLELPGGGGYGDPAERAAEQRERDRRDGLAEGE